MKHSLIVPIHNGSEFIGMFWQSLMPNIPTDSELLVVDDGSREPRELLVPEFPGQLCSRVLRNDKSEGYAKAVNKALDIARGKYIYLLNSDLILGSGAIQLLHRYLSSDTAVGVVGAKLLYPQSGRIQHFGLAFTPTRKFHIFTHMDPSNPLVNTPTRFQAVTFALCGIRRELAQELGGLDNSFCNGSEDIDFCLRAREKGYRNVVPSEVTSHHWESLSGDGARHVVTLENEARFWGRWSGKIESDSTYFVANSLRQFLHNNPQSREMTFTVVNLSPGEDFTLIRQALEQEFSSFSLFSHWDYSRVGRNNGQIWLPMTLPFDAIRTPQPFLFVVHEYPQLQGNHYWLECRQQFCKEDIIVDHYANVLKAADPSLRRNARRHKGPLDAS